MSVTAEERARWHQKVVYAWIRDEEVLYVGCSTRGVERPMGHGHEKLREIQPGDHVVVWPCDDPAVTEEALIRRWRPRYNKPNGGTPCPGCGGRWKLADRAAGGCRYCVSRAKHTGLDKVIPK